MIAYVEGPLVIKEPGQLVIDCHGVGYRVRVSLNTYSKLQGHSKARVWTHLQVKEDGHTLYGFAELAERDAFEMLIAISGVGGGTALTVLSSLNPSELATAVARGDVTSLKRIKGIGQKTAERIVLELRGRFDGAAVSGPSATPASRLREEALSALVGLGFPKAQVEKRVDELLAADPALSLEAVVKQVLRGA